MGYACVRIIQWTFYIQFLICRWTNYCHESIQAIQTLAAKIHYFCFEARGKHCGRINDSLKNKWQHVHIINWKLVCVKADMFYPKSPCVLHYWQCQLKLAVWNKLLKQIIILQTFLTSLVKVIESKRNLTVCKQTLLLYCECNSTFLKFFSETLVIW